MRRTRLMRTVRSHHDRREFDQAMRAASPAMQQELMAAAARSTTARFR